jgi:hypothetical protein
MGRDDRRLLPNICIGDVAGEFDVIRRSHEDKVKAFVSKAKTTSPRARRTWARML